MIPTNCSEESNNETCCLDDIGFEKYKTVHLSDRREYVFMGDENWTFERLRKRIS